MAEGQNATDFPEFPTERGAAVDNGDLSLKPEALSSSSPTCEESINVQSPSRPLPPGLLSMPCLLKELRRDSSPEPVQPEKGTVAPVIQICPQEDSDSSACLRSPSSSGHLGDSDTVSSAEDEDLGNAKPTTSSHSDPAPRKSSRRSRSESDASAGVAMAAKKNRCQERQPHGGRTRERGKRSQRHKERMRLLRQKREALAKGKSRPLEDSSTSDSDATAHSSSSSSTASSDNEGGTVSLHAPAGRRGNSMGGVLEEALTRVAAAQRRTEERFRAWMERISRLHSGDDDEQSYSGNPEGRSHVGTEETPAAYRIIRLNNVGPEVIGHYDVSDTHSEQEQQLQTLSDLNDPKNGEWNFYQDMIWHRTLIKCPVEVVPPQVSLPLSDSEVEIVGVQENASAVSRFPRGGVIQSLSSWKQTAMPHWTAVAAQPDWASPSEVVDLTLDEDRHRYLL